MKTGMIVFSIILIPGFFMGVYDIKRGIYAEVREYGLYAPMIFVPLIPVFWYLTIVI